MPLDKPANSGSEQPANIQLDVEQALVVLSETDKEIHESLRPIIDRLQRFLSGLEGKSFGSFESNQRVARLIQEMAARLGMALECPNEECQRPAQLRCGKRGRAGIFQFEHSIERKQTSHGYYETIPPLKLIPILAKRSQA